MKKQREGWVTLPDGRHILIGDDAGDKGGGKATPSAPASGTPPRHLPQYGINSKDVAKQYGMPEDFYGRDDETGQVSSKYRTAEYDAAVDAEKRAQSAIGINGPAIRRQARQRTDAAFADLVAKARAGTPAATTTKGTEPADKKYADALAKANIVSKEYRQAVQDYRSRKIGDAEYLAARAKYAASQKEFDQAHADAQARGEPPKPKTPKEKSRQISLFKKNESRREALRMLRARCTPADFPDALFGVQTLLEADAHDDAVNRLPDGKRGTLEDLRRKMEQAEGTHDAETIQALLDALKTYLDDAMYDTTDEPSDTRADDKGGGMAKDEMEARRHAAEADGFSKYDDDADELEERRAKAEADQFQKYGQADEEPDGDECPAGMKATSADDDEDAAEEGATPPPPPLYADEDAEDAEDEAEEASYKCAACGYEEGKREAKKEESKREGKRESRRHLSQKPMREAGMSAQMQRRLTALERENALLKTERKARQMRERAVKAIRKAGVEELVEVDHLCAFRESQWPLVINMAQSNRPPQHYMPSSELREERVRPRTTTPMSAAEYFEAHYGEEA